MTILCYPIEKSKLGDFPRRVLQQVPVRYRNRASILGQFRDATEGRERTGGDDVYELPLNRDSRNV